MTRVRCRPEDIERLSRHYQAILRSAVDEPRAEALDLKVLDEAQEQEILVGFNGLKTDYPSDLLSFTSGLRQSRDGTRIGLRSSTNSRF